MSTMEILSPWLLTTFRFTVRTIRFFKLRRTQFPIPRW